MISLHRVEERIAPDCPIFPGEEDRFRKDFQRFVSGAIDLARAINGDLGTLWITSEPQESVIILRATFQYSHDNTEESE